MMRRPLVYIETGIPSDRVNAVLGLSGPAVVTPLQLLGGEGP